MEIYENVKQLLFQTGYKIYGFGMDIHHKDFNNPND